jgi:hypothetical protein
MLQLYVGKSHNRQYEILYKMEQVARCGVHTSNLSTCKAEPVWDTQQHSDSNKQTKNRRGKMST